RQIGADIVNLTRQSQTDRRRISTGCYLGQTGVVEQVSEYRVETLCAGDCIEAVIEALRHAHPYEEPAFDVWRLEAHLMQRR
ncbi:MAG: hypothetical protein V7748_15115, partial [Halopseudomonas sp.]